MMIIKNNCVAVKAAATTDVVFLSSLLLLLQIYKFIYFEIVSGTFFLAKGIFQQAEMIAEILAFFNSTSVA